jgi:hypothetical protein
MKNRTWLVLSVLALCAGCATDAHKVAVASVPPQPPKPAPVPVAGTQMDPKSTESVRYTESLKAYPVNRYIDPNDPNVMHEGHVIYRRENTGGWNLNPNAPTVVPLGPALAVADPAREPNPLPPELEEKMAEQNQLMASLIEQNEALTKKLAQLSKEIGDLRQHGAIAATEDKK